MNVGRHDFSELQELLEVLCEERASSEQVARIQLLARSSPAAMQFYIDYLDQHARLMWRFRRFASDGLGEPTLHCPISSGDAASSMPAVLSFENPFASSSHRELPLGTLPSAIQPGQGDAANGVFARALKVLGQVVTLPCGGERRRFVLAARAACLGLICFALGVVAARFAARAENGNVIALKGGAAQLNTDENVASFAYAATLTNVTNCRWDPHRSTADVSSGTVRPGQSLNLVEGVAEINSSLPSGGFGRFQLEGPVSMILTSQGMPSLQFGKLAAQVTCEFDRFTLDTPQGRAILSPEASIGVIVAANEVELHVFSGEAKYEPLWPMNFSNSTDDLKVQAGASMRIVTEVAGSFAIHRGDAEESRFVTRVSMTASRLDISRNYVAEVRKAQPIAYWRFETDTDGLVRNEMADRFHCRIHGDGVRWHSYQGNRSAEFGSTPEVGCLITDDVLDDVVKQSYTTEAWIKPSHYHHGTVFSFINWTEQNSTIPRHGMVFEICGPVVGPVGGIDSWARYPGRIRFLHRNPPGDFQGVSCYSDAPYVLRKWQHVAGVKDGGEMRLYLDGKLAATGQDSTELPAGMRVLIGQLFPHDPRRVITSRPFVGELDEVAVYNRALTAKEVARHSQLGRPLTEAKHAASY